MKLLRVAGLSGGTAALGIAILAIIPFILVSDSDRTIARLYGATWFSGLLPFARRVTYLIDKKGIVRAVSHHEFAIGRHTAEMMAALEEVEKKK